MVALYNILPHGAVGVTQEQDKYFSCSILNDKKKLSVFMQCTIGFEMYSTGIELNGIQSQECGKPSPRRE